MVEGCNIHRLPYAADEDGSLQVSPGSSTERACKVDYDDEFIGKLLESNKFEVAGNGYFFSKDSIRLLEARPSPVSLAGSYQLHVPAEVATIDEGRFSFVGCNIHSFEYNVKGRNKIEFGLVMSTRRACQYDHDSLYLNKILDAVEFQVDRGQINFYDDSSELTTTFISL